MINQLLKLGALIATGRFLKPRLKGLLYIAVVWIVLWFVHSEYVDYVELSGDARFVLQATLIKTGLYALSIALYVLMVEKKLWPKPVRMPPVAEKPESPPAQRPSQRASQGPMQSSAEVLSPGGDDGFDFLRNKAQLKKQSDLTRKQ